MLTKLLINSAVIAGVSLAGVSYLNYHGKKSDAEKLHAQDATEQTTFAPKPASKPAVRRSASVVSIPKNPRSGQYHYRGRVNSGYVEFLVDTGASAVALTEADARKSGVKMSALKYDVPVSTAGGTNFAARVTLDQVALGGIMLRDVDALIIKDGLTTSLLGMSYLGQLQEVKATPNALLLRY